MIHSIKSDKIYYIFYLINPLYMDIRTQRTFTTNEGATPPYTRATPGHSSLNKIYPAKPGEILKDPNL